MRGGALRITPAHAGKSIVLPRLLIFGEDHPRPCGEKKLDQSELVYKAGSPPPMRGKGAGSANCRGAAGITPAHAGKRTVVAALVCVAQDHPRPCGEKYCRRLAVNMISGSPPPMRGKDIIHLPP